MNHNYRFLVLVVILCFCTGIIACSKSDHAKTQEQSEAEVTEELPLLSTEETIASFPWEEFTVISPETIEPPETNEEMPLYTQTSNFSEQYGSDTVIPSTMGFLNYYNQSDPRWGDTPYGTTDHLRSHGCGPTAVAMVASSYTTNPVTPPDVAKWASDNGYCSSGEGSLHALIPDGLTNYGLSVKPLEERSVEALYRELNNGNLIIALMNRGFFTQSGHFIVLTQVNENGMLQIADPASWENTTMAWNPGFILNQVRQKADAGGPLWVISLPSED